MRPCTAVYRGGGCGVVYALTWGHRRLCLAVVDGDLVGWLVIAVMVVWGNKTGKRGLSDWNEPYSQNQRPPSTPNTERAGGNRRSRRWGAGYPYLVNNFVQEGFVLGVGDLWALAPRARAGIVLHQSAKMGYRRCGGRCAWYLGSARHVTGGDAGPERLEKPGLGLPAKVPSQRQRPRRSPGGGSREFAFA